MLRIDDNTNITSIHSVLRISNHRPKGSIHHYNPNLKHHELVYQRTGDCLSTLDGVEYHFEKGSILYMPQRKYDDYHILTQENGECIDIFFHTDTPLADHPVLLPPPHRQQIADLFTRSDELWLTNRSVRQLQVKAALYEILAQLQREAEGRQITSTARHALDAGLQYLTQHCFDPKIDFHAAAAHAGVSYSYLKRLFSEKLGIPPIRFVVSRRMEYAKDYLTATTTSLAEIAEALGYSNVYYFSRVFKEENGTSPSEYRENMR